MAESVRGLQIHVSKLLLICAVAAIAATAGLGVAIIMDASRPPPPRGPEGPVPPPPGPSEALVVSVGLFVLAWLAVLVVLSRDQIMHRIAATTGADLESMEERITALMKEYGEQRETDGYVNGMRTALAGREGDVRPFRGPSGRQTR